MQHDNSPSPPNTPPPLIRGRRAVNPSKSLPPGRPTVPLPFSPRASASSRPQTQLPTPAPPPVAMASE
eukprot:scaffold167392_cov31-Tisochrysis_lutea.AAC.2